jgi:hypothetical protein
VRSCRHDAARLARRFALPGRLLFLTRISSGC